MQKQAKNWYSSHSNTQTCMHTLPHTCIHFTYSIHYTHALKMIIGWRKSLRWEWRATAMKSGGETGCQSCEVASDLPCVPGHCTDRREGFCPHLSPITVTSQRRTYRSNAILIWQCCVCVCACVLETLHRCVCLGEMYVHMPCVQVTELWEVCWCVSHCLCDCEVCVRVCDKGGGYGSDALISKRWGVSLGAISDTSLSEPSSAVAGLTERKPAGGLCTLISPFTSLYPALFSFISLSLAIYQTVMGKCYICEDYLHLTPRAYIIK